MTTNADLTTPFFPGEDLDTFTIGGEKSPGQCRIVKAPNLQRWQINQGNAISGASMVPMGEDVNDVEIALYFWTEAQRKQFEGFASRWLKAATVTAPGGVDSLALAIGHPILRMPPVSITKVAYKGCSELQLDEEGGASLSLTFIKWKRPILAKPKPLATIPPAAKPKPTATDARQQVIAQQGAELAALAKPFTTNIGLGQ
jgi:hypothetical protein